MKNSPSPIALGPEKIHGTEPVFIFMSGKALRQEIEIVAKALPKQERHSHEPKMEDTDWMDLSFDVEAALSLQLTVDKDGIAFYVAQALATVRWSENGLLRSRLEFVSGHILGLMLHDENHNWGSPGAFAVSPLWNRRIGCIVAGILHPAWVALQHVPAMIPRQ